MTVRQNGTAESRTRIRAFDAGYEAGLVDALAVIHRRRAILRDSGDILHAALLERLAETIRRTCQPEHDDE